MLLLAFASLADAGRPNLLGLTAVEYVSVVRRALANASGPSLFDQLARTKAAAVAGDISSDCADLQRSKSELRDQIENETITKFDLDNKIRGLDEKVRHWANDINRFENEVDKMTELDLGSLRRRILDLSTHKLPELDLVRESWRLDDVASRKAAENHLDAAIVDLQEVLRASKCLSDSITAKQPACDAGTLAPPVDHPGSPSK